jgi:hypothetical protein
MLFADAPIETIMGNTGVSDERLRAALNATGYWRDCFKAIEEEEGALFGNTFMMR